MKRLRRLTLVCLCLASGFAGAETPDLLLANVYEGDVELSHYWISEKLDGVRARWDGTHLISRGGNVFHAPTWFTRDFPDTPLDGELWMGRGTFEALSGTVRQERPDDTQWRRVKYMVFDLPSYPGTFDERLLAMRRLVVHSDSRYLDVIKQFKVDNAASLRTRLLDVVAAGGEGLMLHRADSTYRAGRSDDLLKLKLYRDAEATVIGYTEASG
ncbi:MAG: DNA ligase, partial [Pseudomonadales bacterium]|nr:DNA ligase [Pseudomonadales bacterium]